MPFRRIIGHHRVLSLLARAVAHERVPPALLLAGPRGVGKRRVAQALAEALNCLTPLVRGSDPVNDPTKGSDPAPRQARGGLSSSKAGDGATQGLELDACGDCVPCRRIARAVHPDILVIEPGDTGSIKIEQVRDAIDRAAYRPFEGRRRVVIVDDADAMMPAAQSALLKTLEEPPSASVFVLVSAMPDALLATVRSRCPRLRFGLLSAAEVAGALVRDHGYAEPDARAVAADAEGSIGRALDARSGDLADARQTAQRLLEDTARPTNPGRRLDAAKNLTGKTSTSAGERDQLAVCLRALSSLLRDLGILSTRADARMLANADLQAELSRLATAWDSRRSMRAFTAVDRALGALERNASPKVVADWLVLQL